MRFARFLIFFLCMTAGSALAETSRLPLRRQASIRSSHPGIPVQPVSVRAREYRDPTRAAFKRFGIGFGLVGDPSPTVAAITARLRPLRNLVVSAGFGYIGAGLAVESEKPGPGSNLTFTTYGGSARLIHGRWKLSPSLGMGVTRVVIGKNGLFDDFKLFGKKTESFTHAFASAGLDWQLGRSWALVAGVNRSFDRDLPWLPYLGLTYLIF